MKHLEELRKVRVKRDEAFALAEKSKGAKKAEALDAALTAVGESLAYSVYAKTIEEIIKLDADDEAGLRSKYQAKQQAAEVQSLVLPDGLGSTCLSYCAGCGEFPMGPGYERQYTDWVMLGKPMCWAGNTFPEWRYQCDGDADGSDSGMPFRYLVYITDLTILIDNWKKKATRLKIWGRPSRTRWTIIPTWPPLSAGNSSQVACSAGSSSAAVASVLRWPPTR